MPFVLEKGFHEDRLVPEVVAEQDTFIDIRRRIHANPELGADVADTATLVAGLLRDWGLQNVYEIYPVWSHRYAPGVTHNTEHVFGLTVPAGTPVTPPAGLPTVKLDDKGAPTITPVKTAAPTSLVVQPLIQGSGATVASGQSITVQYSGWLWDGTAFDSSWTKGTPLSGLTIGQNQVIKGWDQGLVGQKVGSQVLLIIPPSLGYGATAQGTIPANSTLVFVVDILAAG